MKYLHLVFCAFALCATTAMADAAPAPAAVPAPALPRSQPIPPKRPFDFAKEYVDELAHYQKLRDANLGELNHMSKRNADRDLLQACGSSSKAFSLSLLTDMGTLNNFHIAPPFDVLPPKIANLYKIKAELYNKLGNNCANMLLNHDQPVDEQKMGADITKLSGAIDYMDRSLFETVSPLVIGTLIAPAMDGAGKPRSLNITQKERKEILKKIDALFGKGLEGENLYYAASSAKLFKKTLEGELKSSDEPLK